MASIEGGSCLNDKDCSQEQYCYDVSKTCVNYTQCSRYNRQENANKKAREPSQCGPCLPGYTAEELGTGEAALCKKTVAQNNVPHVGTLNPAAIIYICVAIGGVFVIIGFCILIYFKRRATKRSEDLEQCNDLCVIEPSAPPVETSPFIDYNKGPSFIPFNNNQNLKDRNTFVKASSFKPPNWVRTDPNYEHNLNNESVVTPLNDDQSNAWPPEQLVLEVANGNLVPHEIEQVDNNTNTSLVQTINPSSSSTNEEEDNNNNNNTNNNSSHNSNDNGNNGPTCGAGNGRSNREHVRTSNVLMISQNINMNVNLHQR